MNKAKDRNKKFEFREKNTSAKLETVDNYVRHLKFIMFKLKINEND